MDPKSAAETMPSLRNFRTGTVQNFCRVFNLVSIINIKRGFANEPYLATCTAVRKNESTLLVSLFDVPVSEYEAFARREVRLRHELTEFNEANDSPGHRVGKGILCTAFSDEEYFIQRCQVLAVMNSEYSRNVCVFHVSTRASSHPLFYFYQSVSEAI